MKAPVKGPSRKANAKGLDRTKLAAAKSGAALKSMSNRFDNPKGKNAGLTLSQALGRASMENNLFKEAEKLYSERDKAKQSGKASATNAVRPAGKPSGMPKKKK